MAEADGRARTPIRRGDKVAQAVARSIVRKIRAEGLQVGAQLPSEAQMLEEYGVGRGSLREALRILEVHGLISIKPGPRGGPIVAETDTGDFGRMASLYFQVSGMTYRELIEARLVMEPVMARLAAERRDPEAVARLRESGEAGRADDETGYLASTGDFHRMVGEMSGNGVLFLFSQSLSDLFRERVSGIVFPKSRRREVLAVHAAIAKAIEEGDADEAERLMFEHMDKYVTYVKRAHPSLIDEVVDWR
ncbi:DNA-binding FadR family transcriptional regulator [Thermocatellispora tengchongensis]|uniref:DNA-binding FadR family transcriptional regulator n=1 Tax=Thermocatellispora tengchongensis TaxID=1073253 RepID=A0A840PSM3_9ACTN|nr:FCD domain-containing protein [Thermocatellispora tengchongensis]MBB5138945.1 DNA-binding FadR family transcriptional regulator [Thermocatellispora tengchongensis]